ncbi:MAG: alpha/beta hydrolase [Gemmatimonadota bacterium]
MNRLPAGLLAVAALIVAAAIGGVVGGGAAITLVKTAYNGPVVFPVQSEIAVHSDVLGETIVFRVHTPVEYGSDSERRFPVIWVLDGSSQGEGVHRATRTLSRISAAEPSIVVEVPHTSAGRTEDFTPPHDLQTTAGGQADRLLRLLESEAMPAVNQAFRTDSVNVLVGYSLGGLFSLYAFTESPMLFDAWLVFSPSVWVGDEAIIPVLDQALREPREIDTYLFVSVGADEGGDMRSGVEAVRAALETAAPAGLDWRVEITVGADHFSNLELSYPVALTRFWGN